MRYRIDNDQAAFPGRLDLFRMIGPRHGLAGANEI